MVIIKRLCSFERIWFSICLHVKSLSTLFSLLRRKDLVVGLAFMLPLDLRLLLYGYDD